MPKLKKVKVGDTIGVFAPGSAADPLLVEAGLETVRSLGFVPRVLGEPSSRFGVTDQGFGSAPALVRADALHALLEMPDVSAVIAVRGGYGSTQILDHLDFGIIAKARKAIIGYSDVTALLLAIYHRTQLPVIHGPTICAEFASYSTGAVYERSVRSLIDLLCDGSLPGPFSCEVLREGSGDGWLLPANLTILETALATQFDLSFDGAILVLEDIAEAPYRLHRTLLHLKQAGKFDALRGVVLGRFTRCDSGWGPTLEELIRLMAEEIFNRTNCPILRGLPFGHEGENQPLALGLRAQIEGGMFSILESPMMEGS